jgi:hypothetical protein
MKLACFLLALSAFAQQPQGYVTTPRYQANHTASAATSDVVTVQQVANGYKTVFFEKAWVYCSAACSFTLEQRGTAATTTALTPAALNQSPPSAVAAFSASNVGTGAYVSNAYNVAAGGTFVVDLSYMFLNQNGGTAQNLSIRVSSASGTISTTIQWVEQ